VRFAQAHVQADAGEEEAALHLYRSLEDDTPLGQAARYNSANLLIRQAVAVQGGSEPGKAIPLIELAKEIYRDVLRVEPGRWDARYNLERAQRLLPDPVLLGLEPFGSRDPLLPLPRTAIRVETHPGNMISLWTHTVGGPGELLTWHRAAGGLPAWPTCDTADTAVLIVGDTHRIQLSWAALWDGQIGRMRLIDPTRRPTPPRTGTRRSIRTAPRSSPR
jgi:hypothetical protein